MLSFMKCANVIYNSQEREIPSLKLKTIAIFYNESALTDVLKQDKQIPDWARVLHVTKSDCVSFTPHPMPFANLY